MATPAPETAEGIIDRKLHFCPRLKTFPIENLITTCPSCHQFYLYCCHCTQRREQGDNDICHHYPLVFTDGACRLNGQLGATAGIGIAGGEREADQRAVPITEALDPRQMRTSQRAELWAAIQGVEYIATRDRGQELDQDQGQGAKKRSLVVATDSEYVVRGMTEWMPVWRSNGYRTNRGNRPSNLDLYLRLDRAVAELERDRDWEVGFWHVPRGNNAIADRLAKEAAVLGDTRRGFVA
ncbi:hypothetical protein G7Y79_00018g045270 [Physcia stellaris]|nr:hypothetical protein G7Y79_00018g045270 [Physcia stellaris]